MHEGADLVAARFEPAIDLVRDDDGGQDYPGEEEDLDRADSLQGSPAS